MPDEPRQPRRAPMPTGATPPEASPVTTSPAIGDAPSPRPSPATAPDPGPSPATAPDWEARYNSLLAKIKEVTRQCDYLLANMAKSKFTVAEVHGVLQRLASDTRNLQ